MNLMRNLRRSLAERNVMGFKLDHSDDQQFVGIVTHLRPDIVAVQVFDDCELTGTVVVPVKRLKEVRDSANHRCYTRVVEHNGQLQKLKPKRWLEQCETMADVFAQLMQRDIWPEVTIAVGKDERFYIGPLTLVEEEGFLIRHYTASGKWLKVQGYRMENVAMVEFDDKYGRHFRNYMESLERIE